MWLFSNDIICSEINTFNTLTGYFSGTPWLYHVEPPPLCSQNFLNLSSHRQKICPYWHNSIKQLLNIWQQHICDINTTMPPHPKDALLDWNLLSLEGISGGWTHCLSQVDFSFQQQHSGRPRYINDAELTLRGQNCASHTIIPLCHLNIAVSCS